MTLQVHKLIDGAIELSHYDGEQYLPFVKKTAIAAEKFDFGDLAFETELNIANGERTYTIPRNSEHNIWVNLWVDGLLDLPSESVWYEFSLGHRRTGFLVWKDNDDWNIFDFYYEKGKWVWDTILRDLDKKETSQAGHLMIGIADSTKTGYDFVDTLSETTKQQLEMVAWLTLYLTLMLHSRTTEIRTEHAPPKLNAARAKQGKSPLFDHRVVTIVPKKFITNAGDQGGTHASPRLHWRATHRRHFKEEPLGSDRAVWMPDVEWMGSKGWWVTMIPRCLIGKAELGTVEHTYKVRM